MMRLHRPRNLPGGPIDNGISGAQHDVELDAESDQGAAAAASGVAGKKLLQRIFYAVGPGDVVGQYRDLLAGKEPAFQLGMSFTQQFLEACDAAGGRAHLISWHSRPDRVEYGKHVMENRPRRWFLARGVKHQIGLVTYGLGIVAQAVRGRATVAIVDSGTTHWFVLSLFALFRIPVIPVLYSALWPMGFPPKNRAHRIVLALDGWFFRHVAAATVCMSPELERQVKQVAQRPKGSCFQFRPQYREEFLRRVPAVAPPPFKPFNVLFLGRVEGFKGVFDILAMAERLESAMLEGEMPGGFAWRIFGFGEDFERLQAEIEARELGRLVLAGHMLPSEQSAMETLSWAHAMIVPTTSAFREGLAMTAAECVLAGRPVVLSDVVPAWEILNGAAIKCKTDSVESFVNALRRLATDAEYYEQHRRATADVQAQFYDRQQGVGNAIMRAIAAAK